MGKRLWRQNKWLWIIAVLVVVGIKIFSLDAHLVETVYTFGFYFFFSNLQRVCFGWIPVSIGDVLYFAAACWLIFKLVKTIKSLFSRQLSGGMFISKSLKTLLAVLFIYVIFNIFWGLNYNRKGIAAQLNLYAGSYDTADVLELQHVLLQKVNASKAGWMRSDSTYPTKQNLFLRAEACYQTAEKVYPFLRYTNLSVKSSAYGWAGNYLGFTGYYNPFTGEAQVNTTVPKFLQPYITTHEMAHQLGYAKEDEANFAGYLAAVNSADTLFHYSAYLDLFIYANREVFYFDSSAAKAARELLIPEVKNDIEEWRRFNRAHRSFIEPAISWMYGNYLKLNQQPQGLRSYDEVISMLVSYYKKYGKI